MYDIALSQGNADKSKCMCNAGHYMETSDSNMECTQCAPGKYKETIAIAVDFNEVCILECQAQCDLFLSLSLTGSLYLALS